MNWGYGIIIMPEANESKHNPNLTETSRSNRYPEVTIPQYCVYFTSRTNRIIIKASNEIVLHTESPAMQVRIDYVLHLKQTGTDYVDYNKHVTLNDYMVSSVHSDASAGRSVTVNLPRVVDRMPLLRKSVSSRVI